MMTLRSKIKLDPKIHFQSVEDRLYDLLRRQIVDLELEPGLRLGLEDLAQQYGVSHMPVRQALRRLESDGLVFTMPRRGSRVAPLVYEELEEIQIVRLGIESYLARLGAENMTAVRQVEMERRLDDLNVKFANGNLDGYLEAQACLRECCYASADRPRLLKVSVDQRSRAERYLRFLCAGVEALGASRQHQERLVEACRQRDSVAAEQSTHDALMWTLQSVGSLLEAEHSRASAE